MLAGICKHLFFAYSKAGGYAVKRMSDNDAWYGDFYKEHKRRPNKAELLEMAREVYKGGGEKYAMPEYTFEVTEERKADFDALDNAFEEMYALEDIKDKIDDLTASEMAVVRSLTPSGYKVYQQAKKQFVSGNTDVQKASRMNAILLARYADRMADNLTKITGKPYTAEDYMHERLHIVADAQNADARGYGQGVPVESFYTVEVTENEFGNYKNLSDLRKKALEWYKNNLQGTVAHNHALGEIIIDKSMAEQDILFGGKGRRKMSSTSAKAEKMLLVKHLKDLTENANFITEAEASDNKHIGEHFYYLHGTILFGGEKQYVIVTVRKTQEKQLLYYNHNVYTPNEYKKIEGYLQETLGSRSSSPNQYSQEVPSVNNSIPEGAEVFNKQKIFYQVYNQTAYHGSPHISIIERYNQSVRGQTQIGGMSRVVSLFENADKSTFDDPDGNSSVNGTRSCCRNEKKAVYYI